MANVIRINGKDVKDAKAAKMASIAPIEATSTASAAYSVGEYFWLDGTLYEATSAIAIGDSIVSGTNCAEAVLGEDVTDLKSQTDAIQDKLTVYGEPLSLTLELGNIGMTGGKINAQYAMRTKYALPLANLQGRKLQILNDYWGVRVSWYSDNKYYIEYCVGVQNYYNDGIIDIQAETVKHGYSTATHYAFAFIHFVDGAVDTSVVITPEQQAAFDDNYKLRTIEWADTSILTTGDVENRLETLESKEAINLFDKTTVANGRISIVNGTVDYNVSSSRISDYIPVYELTKYILFPEYQAANHGMAFYNANKQFISGINTSVSGTSGQRPYIFKTPTGTAFLRFSVYVDYVDAAYLYKYNAAAIASASIPLKSEGQPIVVYPTIDIYPIFKVDLTNYGHPQGGAVYGDKLFCMTTNLENPFLIDLQTYETTQISYSETSTNHGNNVSFSNKFYAEDDPYPLMYVTSASGETSNSCEIFRIVESNGAYSMTKLSSLTLPIDTTKWRGFNAIVDAENDRFIVITTKYNGDVIVGPALLIYDLPSGADTDITLEYIQKDSEHPYGFIAELMYNKKSVGTRAQDAYQQDAFARNNNLFLAIGYSGTSVINVIDADTGARLSFVNIASVFSGEVEVCDTYDNGIVLMDEAGRGYYIKKLN